MGIKGSAIALNDDHNREELLDLLYAAEGLAQEDFHFVTRTPDKGEDIPLSFAQERFWLIDQIYPGLPLYNIPIATRITADLDIGVFSRALTEVFRRHEVLQGVFVLANGRPCQRIQPITAPPISVVDLRGLPAAQRDNEVRELANREAIAPFDLAVGPLLRAKILWLAAREFIVLLTTHHIVSDRWSTTILIDELGALYTAYQRGLPSPLPELPVQYSDFTRWQRDRVRGEALQSQIDYWRDEIGDPEEVMQLPTDHRRPAERTFRSASRSFECSATLTAALRQLSRKCKVTLFTTALAAFQALLHRYTGQASIRVGAPVSGRDRLEFERVIGVFINTLVLRADCSDDPPFEVLLSRVHEATLRALAHKDVPFERLIEELLPAHDISTSPLFQVMFVFEERRPGEKAGARRQSRPVAFDANASQFDLTLIAHEEEHTLSCELTYSVELFESERIDRMIRHLVSALEDIVANPATRLSAIRILSERERAQLIGDWNGPRHEYSDDLCLYQIIERQARRAPDKVAVKCGAHQMTYGELNRLANRWAHSLRRLGVMRGDIVGLCFPRSIEMIVAMQAVMKSGAAYLPLDDVYPEQRLSYMLAQSGARFVITRQDAMAAAPMRQELQVLVVGNESDYSAADEQDLDSVVSSQDAVHALYTSGSTGVPKGVLIQHGSLTNVLRWYQHELGVDEHDHFLAVTTISFDIAAVELLLPLMAGASLEIVSSETARDGAELVRINAEERFTVVQGTPATWQLLLHAGWPDGCRVALSAGEPLSPVLASRLAESASQAWNLYGPTEATVIVTARRIQSADDGIRLGRPVSNTQVHVLGHAMELAPAGVIGELYIGGVPLARGYINDPAGTAERFVPDPFGSGARIYRTGDLGRREADGCLLFEGRADRQVKIRGYRIELGEIASVLSRHPMIRQTAVVSCPHPAGGNVIVAYVSMLREEAAHSNGVNRAGPPLAENEVETLRDHLRQYLPLYMLPAAIIEVGEIPKLPNGKVNESALPPWRGKSIHDDSLSLAPRRPVEQILAGVWSEVLARESVGVDDNFFHIGGHSLLAAQVMSRIRQIFGVDLPLRVIFENPLIGSLAGQIQSALHSESSLTSPIRAVPRQDLLPVSFAQQRLWYLHQLNPASSAYHIPISLRLGGDIDANVLIQTLREIGRRHEVLRTSFAVVEGIPWQVIAPEMKIEFREFDLTHLPDEERELESRRLTRLETEAPFDLSAGPMLRTALFKLGADDHRLLITMHHIISDAWSIDVFVKEAAAIYEAFLHGNPCPLDDLPIQYADYAVWQRDFLQGARLERQLAYWRDLLSEEDETLILPLDRPRPAEPAYKGDVIYFSCPDHVSAALRTLGRREGATLFMSLMASFQTLLYRYSGQPTFRIGAPVAGRDRRELEGLIGFFVNTLTFRADCRGNPSFRALLQGVRSAALDSYINQDAPFDKLVSHLQPARDLARNPLFQVMFSVQESNEQPSAIGGLKLRVASERVETTNVKFDLTLFLADSRDGLRGEMLYDEALFDETTIGRMVAQYQTLLEGIAANPDARIGDLPLLTDGERRQLISTWNETRREYPADRSAHDLFEAQVERTPDSIAIVEGSEHVTYLELNGRANQLARYLNALGVEIESRVAVCSRRSSHMITGWLAVLKAGGAYMPLDPKQPVARLDQIIADVRAAAVVADDESAERLNSTNVRIVRLCGAERPGAELDRDNLSLPISSSNIAYVVYTSGSSGEPKGVMTPHRGLVNLAWWHRDAYGLECQTRATHLASAAFDAAEWEVWPYLLTGGRLYLVDEHTQRDPKMLAEFIERNEIEISFAPTPIAELLIVMAWPLAPSLRKLLTGGDRLHSGMTGKGRLIENHYGLTEASVVSTGGTVDVGANDRSPSIGKPIYNTQAYVLDEHQAPAPVGLPGELYIGGDGLARGYWSRPDLTAEKFIPDRLSGNNGERLYRTGDRVRWRSDGELEFLGRLDAQIKIRGSRVELGEIEAALATLPGVQQAVVVARKNADENRLVAYVGGGPELQAEWLRQALIPILPDFMLPSVLMVLPSLPLTSNGKVDRAALPAPIWGGARTERVAPSTPTERALAEIWAKVLDIPEVGVEDNFFELGGDSILSIQIVSRGIEAGLRLTPKQIFQHPTVAELALVAEPIDSNERPAESAAESDGAESPSPLHPIQEWFFERELPDAHWWNQSMWMGTGTGEWVDAEAMERAFEAVQRRHEALRMRFTRAPEGWRQFVAAEPTAACAEVDLRGLSAEAQDRLLPSVAEQLQKSLDLSAGPVARVGIVRMEHSRGDLLLVVAHHLVIDIVSWTIVLEDFHRAYQQIRRGEDVTLPSSTTTYRNWSERLAAHANGLEMAAEAEYWEKALAGEIGELPIDNPQGENLESAASELIVELSREETEELAQEAGRAYQLQPGEALLVAVGRAIAEWSEAPAVVVDVEGHGREELWSDVDLTRTVGWFTTLYPMRLACGGDLGAALKQVKERVRTAPNGGGGYGLLRYAGPPLLRERISRLPRGEVSLNYIGRLRGGSGEVTIRQGQESRGLERSPKAPRAYQIEINAGIDEGRLWVSWRYSGERHHRATIERVAAAVMRNLNEITAHCRVYGGYTPSDFPLTVLSQESLDELVKSLTFESEN